MKFDYIVYGFPIEKIDFNKPFDLLEGNRTSVWGIVSNLAKQNFTVAIVKSDNCEIFNEMKKPENLTLLTENEMLKVLNSANYLIFTATSLQVLKNYYPKITDIRHNNMCARFCFNSPNQYSNEDIEFLKNLKFISFNNNYQVSTFKELSLNIDCEEIPYPMNYAVVDFKYIEAEFNNKVLFMGTIRRMEQLQKLVKFAQINSEAEVNVINSLIFDQSLDCNVYGGLNKPYIKQIDEIANVDKFKKLILEVCCCDCPENIIYLGAYRDKASALLGKCTMALSFTRQQNQMHDDSKILTYLSLGCPVITDRENPAYRFVEETNYGVILDYNASDTDIRNAYNSLSKMSDIDKKLKMANYYQKYNWQNLTKKILEKFNAE